MAGGSKKGHKELLQKFKAKVIGKLFGNIDDSDVPANETLAENIAAYASSSSTLSGLDSLSRTREVKLYGAQCCPTGSKHRSHVNEPVHLVGSSSYISDDEDSGTEQILMKRKKKQKHICSEKRQRDQELASLSSSSSSNQASGSSMGHNMGASIGSGLTKNQRRKLKKKKREKERQARNCQSTEYVFDSSTNNSVSNEVFSPDASSESKLKSVLEFLEAIWDVYYAEYPNKASERSEFLQSLNKLNDTSNKDELMLLYSTMSTLVLRDREMGFKRIEKFKESTSLASDLSSLVTKLFVYWTEEVMNS